jgi:Trk-type K+ transport system membrane component
MNYRMICRVLGQILLIYAELLFLPLIAGLFYGESVLPFVKTIVPTAVLGGLLLLPKPQ